MVCKFYLEDLDELDKSVSVYDQMRNIQDRFMLEKHPNVLASNFEKFDSKGEGGVTRSIYLAMRQFVHKSLT